LNIAIEHARGISSGTKPVASRRLRAGIERASLLDREAIDGMFDLYGAYYGATSRTLFESDLREKDFVVLLRDEDDAIAGFSTLALLDVGAGSDRLRAIYSGDTIIDRLHWGTQALAFTWLRFAGEIKAQVPASPLYWFLIVKGHRTYRYLSAFSIEFYPHWQRPTPPRSQSIMDSLARRRFGDAYDPARGVVSFKESRGHLKPHWAAIEPAELQRPDVSFFLHRNPGYTRGDELVCLTELCSNNLQPLARRVFDRGLAG
jgi:hypothetical protein